jgi:aminoglycoside 6'-N-acetyltransferase I
LDGSEQFSAEEVSVAMELIDVTISIPGQQDYNIFVKEQNNQIIGYHCTGRRPMTDAVFDLYWIVVDASAKGKGFGKELLQHAEQFVKDQSGRLILAETSSKENYGKTRAFYEKNEYSLLAEIKHFYAMDDSLLMFGKYFMLNS